MPLLKDRVFETTSSIGTGAVSLSGAKPGYRTFSSAFSTGDIVYYCITQDAEWEVGYGTLTSGSPWSLTRSNILASSNSNLVVNFGVGTKNIFCTAAADSLVTTTNINNNTLQASVANLGIGGTTTTFKLDVVDQNNQMMSLREYNDYDGPVIRGYRHRGSIAAPTGVLANDNLGGIRTFGLNSSGVINAMSASIDMYAAENFTTTANGSYITLRTTPVGTVGAVERVRVSDTGDVTIGNQLTSGIGNRAAWNSPLTVHQHYDTSMWSNGITSGIGFNTYLATGYVPKTIRSGYSGEIVMNHEGTGGMYFMVAPEVAADTNTARYTWMKTTPAGVVTIPNKLVVSGNASAITVNGGVNPDVRSVSTGGITTILASPDAYSGGYVGTASNHGLGLYTNDTKRVDISSAGAVNIPSSLTAGAIFASGPEVPLFVNSTNNVNIKILLQDNGTNRGYIGASATNALEVINSTNSAYLMTVANSGLVTIHNPLVVSSNIMAGPNGFSPITAGGWLGAAFKASGLYGGAVSLVDGSAGFSIWAQAAGTEFCIGQGTTSGAVSYKLLLTSSGSLTIPSAIQSNDTTTNTRMISSGSIGYIGTTTNHPLVIQSNNTEQIRVNTDGQITLAKNLNAANGFVTSGLRLDATPSAVAANWYRIAVLSDTNQPIEARIVIKSTGQHNNTVIKIGKGTGNYTCEAYTSGRYIYANSIKRIRIVNLGVNQAICVDVQFGDVNSTYHVILADTTSCTINPITLNAFIDQGASAYGQVYEVWGYQKTYGTEQGQNFLIADDGTTLIGRTTNMSGTGKLQVTERISAIGSTTGSASVISAVDNDWFASTWRGVHLIQHGPTVGGNAAYIPITASGLSEIQSVNSSGLAINTNGNAPIYFGVATAIRATINNVGVGIGSVAPSVLFDVTNGTANTAGDPITSGTMHITGPHVSPIDTQCGILNIDSNSDQAGGRGGSIVFGGRYNGFAQAHWAGISGFKQNSNLGEFGGYLSLYSRSHGGGLTEGLRLTPEHDVNIRARLYVRQIEGKSTYDADVTNTSGDLYLNYVTGDTYIGTNAAAKIASNGKITSNDIVTSRSATTGYLFLGSNETKYLGFDGTNYLMPGAHLYVNGRPVVISQDGYRYSTDFNTILASGFYNAEATPPNAPAPYGELIVVKGADTGMQIYGGYNNSLYHRGWWSSGATFSAWATIVDSLNRNSTLAGAVVTGAFGVETGISLTVRDINHGIKYNGGIDGLMCKGFSGITFNTGSDGATERMRITASSVIINEKLGVGGVTPVGNFQVRVAANKNFAVYTGVIDGTAVSINAVNDVYSANIPLELRASAFTFSGIGGGANLSIAATTGAVTIPGALSSGPQTIDTGSSTNLSKSYKIAGSTRWVEYLGGAGLDYRISNYNDSGVQVGDALTISRSTGAVTIPGKITSNSRLTLWGANTTSGDYANGASDGATLYLHDSGSSAGNGGQILFGWGGSGTADNTSDAFAGIKGYITNGTGPAGDLVFQTRATSGNILERMRINSGGTTIIHGATYANGNVYINNSSPTIYLQDTDHRTGSLHCNGNRFYVLRGDGTNSTGWATYNGYWPMDIYLENNDVTFGGNLTAVYNITAYSDERLKKDWAPLQPNIVEKLANVKSGTYTRTDVSEARQVGVSAQSLREVLPEAVTEALDDAKTLSVSYGNAALAMCVELAKEIVLLKEQVRFLQENK